MLISRDSFTRISVVSALLLAACVPTTPMAVKPVSPNSTIVAQAKSLVTYDLIDPTSPLFRNIRTYQIANGDYAVCGEVNGKNRFGGYVGFTPFYVRFTKGPNGPEEKVKYVDGVADAGCRQAASGTINVISGS
jgi:hypothetical protein